jgi:hypothetical protein
MRLLGSVGGATEDQIKKKYRHEMKLKNIQSRKENKGIPAELLLKYAKNANLPNSSENIQLSP